MSADFERNLRNTLNDVATGHYSPDEGLGLILADAAHENAELTRERDELRQALEKAYEWAAKYPLQGDGSVPDCAAATEVYLLAQTALRAPDSREDKS